MYRLPIATAIVLLQLTFSASAERIKRKPLTEIEAARIATDQAMSDGLLRQGDVIATDRGFVQFRGLTPDGSPDFLPVPNPVSRSGKALFSRPH